MRQVIRKTYISMSLRLSLRFSLDISPHELTKEVKEMIISNATVATAFD